MNIVFPDNTTEVIDAIRGAIGRDVTFYSEQRILCSACTLDPFTDTSTNSFCPVCSGIGYQITYSGYTCSGHVFWNPADALVWVTGGKLEDGDCRLQIKFEDGIQEILDNNKFVVVDNRRLEIKNTTFRGVPQVNRVILNLMELERNE